MRQTISIREYDYLCQESQEKTGSKKTLSQSDFSALEQFILANNGEAVELMNISVKKGLGKIITAKNYVGVLSLKSGTTIEILPKIYSETDNPNNARNLLIQMLKTLHSVPYKTIQKSNINTSNLNIFEIFIRMFVDEVFEIVKHGLQCNYERIEDNLTVLKGKINFAKHIKYNLTHKEKVFVEYDSFDINRAENRLLKSTLIYLYKKTISQKNKNDIKTLLNSFATINESDDYAKDFSLCSTKDRTIKKYANALKWSKVFLQNKSFTSFSGSEVAFALLFPMETLFESYIVAQFKKVLNPLKYSITAQDKTYHLFDNQKNFSLKPDIVIKTKNSDQVFILDTKWKILSTTKVNAGISQTDMYQMYAYHKKYKANSVTLLYPKPQEEIPKEKCCFTSTEGAETITVNIKFIDLYSKDSPTELLQEILQ